MTISLKGINYRGSGGEESYVQALAALNEEKNWGLRFDANDSWDDVMIQMSLISSISLAVDVAESDTLPHVLMAPRTLPSLTDVAGLQIQPQLTIDVIETKTNFTLRPTQTLPTITDNNNLVLE